MRFLAALLLFLLPSFALGAGFATQSVFLSKNPVTEGDTVRIYAIVSNTDTATFAGSLAFKEASAVIGTSKITLAAGAAQTVSTAWKPLAGNHIITATLQTTEGKTVEILSETFTIAPSPILKTSEDTRASPANAAAVESSAWIQDKIGGLSPAAQKTTAPAFSVIDSARDSAASFLNGQLASTKKNLAKQSSPVPTSNPDGSVKTPDAMGSAWFVVYTIYLYILTILLFILSNASVFYPVLAIVFLYFLWRMFKKFRRT